MKCEKRIHQGYKEFHKMPALFKTGIMKECLFGKWQYILSDNKGNEISLICLKGLYDDHPWEIYQVKGKESLFDDVERYKTKAEAKKRCFKLLSKKVVIV